MNRRIHITNIVALTGVGLAACLAVRLSGTPADRTWWAFVSPKKSLVPQAISSKSTGLNPVDSFILAKLSEHNLSYAPPADRGTLIRRAAFDLTGLPPDQGLLNLSYEKAVEKLLESPRYGERWGRHWLDVVRFGETDGGEHNYERFNSWPYRDYVINALNRDLPYNEFVRDQLAGDVLHPGDKDKIAATGFLVSGPWDQVSAVLNKDPVMRKTARMDELDDMVTTTSATFLGLTVNCARCHDHKFDPIPSKDYYRMASAFSGAGFGERSIASAEDRKQYDLKLKPLRTELDSIREQLSQIEDPASAKLLDVKYRAFDESRRAEARRIPINPIYNRESFAPVKARYWRMVVSAQAGSRARLDACELKPDGFHAPEWQAKMASSPDKPVMMQMDLGEAKTVSEVLWSTNRKTGDRDGQPTIYRFEASENGTEWKPIVSNLDHNGAIEVDLPTVSDEEISSALASEVRTTRITLQKRAEKLQADINSIPTPARIYAVNPHAPETVALLERGSVAKPLEEVQPGGLSAVGQIPATLAVDKPSDEGMRRIALADWIVDPRNPLTARVIVNRVWYYHFGSGIVNTPSDFGLNGDKPSHPELLDWLAVSFVEHGWSLKWLHKLVMTSAAYRQSSAFNEKAHKIDAGNRLIWRMPLRRMDAETLRDTILSVTGNLNLKQGGPSFALHKKGARGSYIYHALDNDGPEVWRRSVYRFNVRGGDRLFLDSFDCPDPSVATPQRTISNTPLQALTMMNNAFVNRQAGLFATRLVREAAGNKQAQVKRAYLLALGREPRAEEAALGLRFLNTRPLNLFCLALLNSNEFIYTP